MKKYSFGRGKQKGIGLLDLLFWLVIASLLSFGVLRLVKNNMTKAAIADEIETLSMMAGDLRAKFMRTGNFAGLTNATFVSLNIAPPERVTGGNLRSAFETPIDVSAANVNGMANDGFSFTYSNLPSTVCTDFVMSAAPNFARIAINGTVIKDVTNGRNDAEISVVDLGNCAGANGIVASVVFEQGR